MAIDRQTSAYELGQRLTEPLRERVSLPVWMILPSQIVLLFLLVVPVIISIWLSLTSWSPTSPNPWWGAEFIGLENYVSLLTDQQFLYSSGLTILIIAVAVGVEFIIGFGLALLVRGEFKGQKLFVIALLTPMMVMPVVAGNMYFMLFRTTGVVNQVLSWILMTNVEIPWLNSFPVALVPIIVADIWHWYPLLFLIMFSGLNAIPETQVQAARSLGASRLQIFRHIELPNLMPVILIGLVIRAMGAIKLFDLIFILTGGGPGKTTENISMFLFKQTFEFFNIGRSSAAAWIVFVVSVGVFSYALRPLLYEIYEAPEEDGDGEEVSQ